MQQPPLTTARKLTVFLAARQAQPFDWRTNNCCHLAAQWVQRLTGLDPMRGLPITPDGRRAMKLVQRLGGMQRAWSQALCREAIEPLLAQTGDLVLVQLDVDASACGTGHTVGICNGHRVLVLDQAGQVQPVGWAGAVCAWRVEVPA